MDFVQEFLPARYNLLQFTHRCLWAELLFWKGRIYLLRTSQSSMHPNRGYICPSYQGILHIWIIRESWSCLHGDAEIWSSTKYVFILLFSFILHLRSRNINRCPEWWTVNMKIIIHPRSQKDLPIVHFTNIKDESLHACTILKLHYNVCHF